MLNEYFNSEILLKWRDFFHWKNNEMNNLLLKQIFHWLFNSHKYCSNWPKMQDFKPYFQSKILNKIFKYYMNFSIIKDFNTDPK